MAKNDNLTDFLTGIATKIREILWGGGTINPQDFEEKIQECYDAGYSKGYSEGGPAGCTAVAGDVLSGKVFGTGGSGKATGTMVSRPAIVAGVPVDDKTPLGVWLSGDNTVAMGIPLGAYVTPYTDCTGAMVRQSYANVASAIGLTAPKLVAGNTVLGVTGTGMARVYTVGSYAGNQSISVAAAISAVGLTNTAVNVNNFMFSAVSGPYTTGESDGGSNHHVGTATGFSLNKSYSNGTLTVSGATEEIRNNYWGPVRNISYTIVMVY